MDPFGDHTAADTNEMVVGNRCPRAAEIILKRLFKKLFNQVDALQPSELDEEFIYQSSINYDDYLAMVKQMQDDQVTCASLNRLDNILSNFMSQAMVRRPMHTNLFSNLLFSGSSALVNPVHTNYTSGALHMLVVLFIVGLTTWLFQHVARIRAWLSILLSFILVGFVEFYMHKNEMTMNHRNLERCNNPSMLARLASLVNYDYDGCRLESVTTKHKQNIAFIGVEYLSELIFQPLVTFGEKIGKALESYLSSFRGVNYLIAPFFPMILTVAACLGVPLMLYLIFRERRTTVVRRPSRRGLQNGLTQHQLNQLRRLGN
jgi:hypothetical protein